MRILEYKIHNLDWEYINIIININYNTILHFK